MVTGKMLNVVTWNAPWAENYYGSLGDGWGTSPNIQHVTGSKEIFNELKRAESSKFTSKVPRILHVFFKPSLSNQCTKQECSSPEVFCPNMSGKALDAYLWRTAGSVIFVRSIYMWPRFLHVFLVILGGRISKWMAFQSTPHATVGDAKESQDFGKSIILEAPFINIFYFLPFCHSSVNEAEGAVPC